MLLLLTHGGQHLLAAEPALLRVLEEGLRGAGTRVLVVLEGSVVRVDLLFQLGRLVTETYLVDVIGGDLAALVRVAFYQRELLGVPAVVLIGVALEPNLTLVLVLHARHQQIWQFLVLANWHLNYLLLQREIVIRMLAVLAQTICDWVIPHALRCQNAATSF